MALEPVDGKLPSFRLDGRLAVITGASEGIGRAIALAYARSGAEVVLVSRRREKLLEVARSVGGHGGRAHVIRADIGRLKHSGALPKSPNFTHTTQSAFEKSSTNTGGSSWDYPAVLGVHRAKLLGRCEAKNTQEAKCE